MTLSLSPPRKLLIATTNPKKRGEMQTILASTDLDLELLTLQDFPAASEVEETGETFFENSHLKARAGLQLSGLVTIADDGGFCVDALGGSPGVKSHRFLGENTSFEVKMTKILEMMEDVSDEERTCRFQSAVVIALPDGRTFECLGICEGRVAHEMRGDYGFGYDPIFLFPGTGKHMAELLPEDKHKVSHRGKALSCATKHLREIFG